MGQQHVETQSLPFVKPKSTNCHFDKPKGAKVAWPCRGFQVEQYKQDRLGLVLAGPWGCTWGGP